MQMEVIEMPSILKGEDAVLITQQSPCYNLSSFSQEGCSSLESKQKIKPATKLLGLIIFSLLVMAVEIVGGLKANSLSIFTDAAHMLSDVAVNTISLFAVWASAWKATSRQSFGYHRLEVLGALFSVQLIWLISGFLIYEAIERIIRRSSKINGPLMLAVGAFGFLVNMVMMTWLGHDHAHHAWGGEHHNHSHHDHAYHEHHDHSLGYERAETCLQGKEEETNINLQAAYVHVIFDLIQSIGVMIAGVIIWVKPSWLVADLITTLLFSVFALSTTFPMLGRIFTILMERAPKEIDIDALEHELNRIEGVQSVHDLHVWAITVKRTVLSCHVIAKPGVNSNQLLRKIKEFCESRYQVHHITIEIEQQLSSIEAL